MPGTDLDLRYVLADGLSRPFGRGMRDGVLVERGYTDEAAASATLAANPMHVYAYLDGRVLFDLNGALGRLHAQAREVFDAYETPRQAKDTIAFLLGCSRDKIRVALDGGDDLRAAFVTGTSSWQLVEGLWAANGRPLPPNSSVRPHLGDLTVGPPDVEARFHQLFLGSTRERAETALELIDWIIDRLDARQPSA